MGRFITLKIYSGSFIWGDLSYHIEDIQWFLYLLVEFWWSILFHFICQLRRYSYPSSIDGEWYILQSRPFPLLFTGIPIPSITYYIFYSMSRILGIRERLNIWARMCPSQTTSLSSHILHFYNLIQYVYLFIHVYNVLQHNSPLIEADLVVLLSVLLLSYTFLPDRAICS